MKLNVLAVSLVTATPTLERTADNFGLNFTECGSDYFREGAEWVLQVNIAR